MVALPKFKRKTSELDTLDSNGDDDHQPLRQREQNSEDKFEDSSDNKVYVTSNALVHKKGYDALAEQDINTSKDVNCVQALEQDEDLSGEIERYTLWDTVQQLNFWYVSDMHIDIVQKHHIQQLTSPRDHQATVLGTTLYPPKVLRPFTVKSIIYPPICSTS